MGKKKQPLIEDVQFRTLPGFHIPYAYVDPKTNFLGGSSFGEQSYISSFEEGFSLGRQDTGKELDAVISQLKTREGSFIGLLEEKGLIESGDGEWYKIKISQLKENSKKPPPEITGPLETEIKKMRDKKIPEETIEKSLENFSDSAIIEDAKNNLPKCLQTFFNNNFSYLPEWTSPKNIFNAITPKYLEMIEKEEEVPVPLLKLITNTIAWYELPENIGKQDDLYNHLKAYRTSINRQRKKGGRSAVRKASADIQSNSNEMNIQQMINKMQESIRGQAKQQAGNLFEKLLKKSFVKNGFLEDKVHETGNLRITLRTNTNLNINLKEDYGTREFSSDLLLQELNKNKNQARSPKSDLVLEGKDDFYGLSLKTTSLKTTKKLPHKIALHHGSYMSLIRFLSRYTGGVGLANQLAEPGKMHAVLNLVRASGKTTSPSLDIAASELSYAFLGANEGDIFTDYGQEIQDAYNSAMQSSNNVMALIDSFGNMRLISSLLEEIRQNLDKASVQIVFKSGNFNFRTKNGEMSPYTHNVIVKQNFASPSDFSSIEALVHMFSS